MSRTLRLNGRSARSSVHDIADSALDAPSAWWQAILRGSPIMSHSEPHSELRVVDAFCGCGGLSSDRHGRAGDRYASKFSAAIDADQAALEVYARNLEPELVLNTNVDSLVDYHVMDLGSSVSFAYPPEIIDDRLQPSVGNTDVLLAGPPCEGHSNLNNRTRALDPRNALYLSAVALAVALDAKAVVIENVPNVRNDRDAVVPAAHKLLADCGYASVEGVVLSAHEFGGAQTRRRYFLIATKSPSESALSQFHVPFKRPASSVAWAISDLLDLQDRASMFDQSPVPTDENQRRIEWLFDNDAYDLPNSERPECHRNGHTYPSVYGRMRWDQPAQTITTGFLTIGRGRFIHPLRPRVLTPHEAARLQSFPDSFQVPNRRVGIKPKADFQNDWRCCTAYTGFCSWSRGDWSGSQTGPVAPKFVLPVFPANPLHIVHDRWRSSSRSPRRDRPAS